MSELKPEAAMEETARTSATSPDEALVDTTPYGSGKGDSVSDVTENAAITHHAWAVNDVSIRYTATAGHLVTTDLYSARPAAKIFYVAFTADGATATTRPITFFYNGGPGSSSVFLLLGSFGPRRIKTSMPDFTPPAPYALEDNKDSLLDHTDLVFINPVGTGYSAAVAPGTNKDFWGVDEDARSIKQFIKRYLTAFDRWNSPKFLFGESYGTPRTSVLTWMLHEDGVDLNGVVLQSSILDYSQASNPVGLLPTLAADAWFHKKVTLSPRPSDLPTFMDSTIAFDREKYAAARAAFQLGSGVDSAVLQYLSDILGIPPDVLRSWKLDPSIGYGAVFLTRLLQDEGLAVGAYDGRVTASDTGIAQAIDPNSGGNDPTMTAVGGVYATMWNVYLNDELQFTATSPFMDLNDQAFLNWNFDHVDPTGAHVGGRDTLYTAGDLAAAMALNPYLKVFSANGYYDAVTPFFQTVLDFDNMPLEDPKARQNLVMQHYPSGHMIYLDNESRAAMKHDLDAFYEEATAHPSVARALMSPDQARRIFYSRYRRRFTRTPY
jgi:carboxypeptidase C (cathepsin A)